MNFVRALTPINFRLSKESSLFLVAVTSTSIVQNFESSTVEEHKVNSSIVTIVTDSFLSKSILSPGGFSVIESPLIHCHTSRDVIFSEVIIKKDAAIVEVFKSTISGRPIYYHINSKGEFFCSTHISMLRKAGVTIEENAEALPEYFVYRYIMPPQTLYKNIYQLTAGARLYVKLVDQKCVIKSVDQYIPPEQDKQLDSFDSVVRQTFRYLSESLRALETGKDKLAIMLSGGMDSSILFKICQAHYGINSTFSTGYPFEDPEKNVEREYALSAADVLNTRHRYYETTDQDYLRGFLKAICAAEEPLHHLQSVMFYLLFEAGIPLSNDIIVCGLGADSSWGLELHNMLYTTSKWPYRLLLKEPVLKLLRFASSVTGKAQGITTVLSKAKERHAIEEPDNIIWSIDKYGDEDWVCQHFGVTKHSVIKNRLSTIKPFVHRPVYDVISILDFLGDVTITQSIWAKLGESQRKIVYYPYSHHGLLDYAYRIPWNVKLAEPKGILRGVARQLEIPESIITRPKSGFGIRRKGWAERGDIFEPLIPLASKAFDEEQIRGMQSAEPKKAMTFWNILNYSIWKRLCINNEPVEVLLEEMGDVGRSS